ncbi:MAG: cyclopropane fatty acyl phospholipid synthase [Candidatus Sungbacteria bacterium]|uniref:Cyclopropane fatty acyl phospholipid synthase n=1 Tax=Candidatus Sungiibacteriota bacterium TaxID=2750080 RepID=A0A932DSL5_9BACT|nr:cyclopropane fatty acyl phospholipid synthase [Candidatus Sungbacteria bacterium]MBI2466004.1 cyclopropane fatty acyl phospholipid synthase [Candidatus Sungbacteria bacterium]
MNYAKTIKLLLEDAGITLNGHKDFDIQVHNENFYRKVFKNGSLGLGESYMDGWWDVKKLDEFSAHILSAGLKRKIKSSWQILPYLVSQIALNPQRLSKTFEIGEQHYNIGNGLYQAMLGKSLTYTCGYWKNAINLDEAQELKLDLVCRKLRLRPGQKVLDIGCGWGNFAKYAAEKYGIEVTGITVSKEQVELGQRLCKGLPVEIRLQDYRSIKGQFDHVVSLGMFEHVGYKNYRTYMEIMRRCLKDGGFFLLHTIGGNVSTKTTDPWISKYIFPNSMLPSIKQIGKSIEGLFVMEDWHNFGADYDKTLMAWYENFENNWNAIKSNYDERFYRMWKYYLLMCAGSFRTRKNQLWQIVLSKKGALGGYESVR